MTNSFKEQLERDVEAVKKVEEEHRLPTKEEMIESQISMMDPVDLYQLQKDLSWEIDGLLILRGAVEERLGSMGMR